MDKEWSFYIAGVQHHDIYKCLGVMEVGHFLSIVPEPTNKYDKNAIRLVYPEMGEDIMIGYVPGKISHLVKAAILSPNYITSCEITEVNEEEKPWKQCKVMIRAERRKDT